MSSWNIEPDELHLIHLGTNQQLLGSALWMLAYEILPGSASDNMATIWAGIVESYKKYKVAKQYSSLDLNSFCDAKSPKKDYPRLKGKGAEAKDLVLPMLDIWKKYMRPLNKVDQMMLKVLDAQSHMQSILSEYSAEPLLPRKVAKQFSSSTMVMLQGTAVLAQEAYKQKKLLFNIVPKHHYTCHMGFRAHLLNPRLGNTMLDEDFVGKMSCLVSSSAAGTAPHLIPCKVMEKYRYGKWLLHNVK